MSDSGQQQSTPGAEQLDPGLEADFKELMERTVDPGVKKVLERNKAKLLSNGITSEQAVQALSREDIVVCGLNLGDAAILKLAFPSPAAAGAGRAAGVSDSAALVTAYEAIMRSAPGILARTSPRASTSCTRPKQPRTYSGLQPWPEFEQHKQTMIQRLDTHERRFFPVILPGDPLLDEGCHSSAADESEIRGALQSMARLVNHVARSMQIGMELVGGGSGRGASQTDWLVRRAQPSSNRGYTRPVAKRIKANPDAASKYVVACVEVKGTWQVLREGHDMAALTDDVAALTDGEIPKGLKGALQQLYGYMVLEEAPLGMVTVYEKAIMIKRCEDVTDKTLLVSRTVGLDGMLLAFLTLLDLARDLFSMKGNLPRGSVPRTPPTSSGQRSAQQQSLGDGLDGLPDVMPGQRSHQARSSKATTTGAAHTGIQDLSALQVWDVRTGSSDSCHIPSESASTSAGGSGGSHSQDSLAAVPLPNAMWTVHCYDAHQPEHVGVFGFGDVGLTDTVLGIGKYGCVLQGLVGGQLAAIKMFDPKYSGAADAFVRELDVYRFLEVHELQGTATPRLLLHGVFEFTGAFFLALSREGASLRSSFEQTLTGAQVEDVKRVLGQLHSVGVLHGDVRRANIVVGSETVSLKVLDFEQSRLQHTLPDAEWARLVKEEDAAVERL